MGDLVRRAPGTWCALCNGIPNESNWTRQFLSGMIMALCAVQVVAIASTRPVLWRTALQNLMEALSVPGYAIPIRAVLRKDI